MGLGASASQEIGEAAQKREAGVNYFRGMM